MDGVAAAQVLVHSPPEPPDVNLKPTLLAELLYKKVDHHLVVPEVIFVKSKSDPLLWVLVQLFHPW